MTTTNTNAIASRAMLASINISTWEARKQDKALTHEINRAHNAADDAARVHKSLIARKAFAAIDGVAREARRFHYERLSHGPIQARASFRTKAFRRGPTR